jgi:MFS family permease
MFGVGIILGLLWSSMTQFLIPVRGAREFGLDRASVSRLLAIAHVVDLVALLPFGWFADRIGRPLALSLVLGCLAFGAGAVGLGPFPLFVTGSALLGLGMAGWVFPLAMIREHTEAHVFPRRTGFYRVGVDAAAFLGPLLCGLIGEAHTGLFAAAVGAVALAAAFRLGWLALR